MAGDILRSLDKQVYAFDGYEPASQTNSEGVISVSFGGRSFDFVMVDFIYVIPFSMTKIISGGNSRYKILARSFETATTNLSTIFRKSRQRCPR